MDDTLSPTPPLRTDKEKVEFIYREYFLLMRYVAGEVLGKKRRQDADDAVHDAILKIIGSVGAIDFSDTRKLRNLCCVIARNSATDRVRNKDEKSVPLYDIPEETADGAPLPESAAINDETRAAVLDAIRALPPVYRDACLLKYVHLLKENEIASLLGIPVNTASTRIHRGKRILRDVLRKEGFHE